MVSNATTTPLSVSGSGLSKVKTLRLGPPANRSLPLVALDETHAFTVFPSDIELGAAPEAVLVAQLEGGQGSAELRVINDRAFPDLVAMALSTDGQWLALANINDDSVLLMDVSTRGVIRVPVGDGPSAVTALPPNVLPANGAEGPASKALFVVSHWHAGELALVRVPASGEPRVEKVASPKLVAGLAASPDGTVFLAEHARDSVVALDLKAMATNRTPLERWRTNVAPNPKAMALSSAGLAVGSLQTGEIELLDVQSGQVKGRTQPAPGTPIVGGTTAKYSQYIMNGKAPRALVASSKLGALFVSSIGPNIGPNPDKMEVSMNGGVGAVTLPTSPRKAFVWQRHLGFGAGITEALALDEAAGLLYASDVGLGLIRILNAAKLTASDASGAKALIQEVALPPPDAFPRVRPESDLGVKGRAGVSLHSGPKSIVLSNDRKTLFVLNRFTGTVAVIDVTKAAAGQATWKAQFTVADVLSQPTRRLGQVLYFADLGRTAMSCDACHLEGHGEGVLFEKTMPLRIYRSTTVRGSRETPPFFTPASTHSIGETAKVVGSRNRYQNPPLSPEEVEALTLYTSLVPTLPNPFVGPDGVPAETLSLPDGQMGSPRRGMALFEGKAACAQCHPAPQFTTDQSPQTKGRYIDVGTPHAMPLREAMQNTRFEGFAAPALVGAWDIFPMLTTGLAGLAVAPNGEVVVESRFPLRVAVERWAPTHGRADVLSAQEKNDVLAYVMSL
jgi:DNA-binding beta-propeller fold protein YncE